MAGSLDGVRVIDFGQYVAGPLAAMLLGDHGADVIRVDPPGGPRYDTPANATWQRNKRSIVLDLKTGQDRDIACRLVETADVLVENFRPGVMDRLGLGAEAMTGLNRRLIYCSLPGFASDDPRAGVAAWEGVVGAASATYRPGPRSLNPVYTAIPISSCYAAFEAAVSIAVALNARERDGAGQVIEVPLFDATFGAIGSRGLRVFKPRPANPAAGTHWTRQFLCKDGRWFMYHAGNLNFRSFLEKTGAEAWLDAGMTVEEQIQRAEVLFLERTSQEWEDLCEMVGTEGGICRTSAEWLLNPHALQSQIVVDVDDPKLGVVRGPGINVRLSETPGSIRTARPEPGSQRAAILASIGAPTRQPADALDTVPRPALEGVKVIDLCIILAGPTCGRTLAEFGADVIKIDNPRRNPVANHLDVNRGKRSLLLDLKTQEGLDVFWRLVESADVVVQNFRKGVAERLGIGYAVVRARKPDIVYASLNCYGQIGPYAGRPGHEQIAQAASGIQMRYGGDRPALQPYPINDYGTGLMGAYGVALALLHRKRTGKGQHVDTALAYTATILQSGLIQDYSGKKWDEPRGQDCLGSGPLNRAYEAKDGWLFLAGRLDDLKHIPELADLAGLDGEVLASSLAERIRGGQVDSWVTALVRAGFGAHRIIMTVDDVMEDAWVKSHGLSLAREHDELGLVRTTGPVARLSRTPAVPGWPAPKPGADAAGILSEIDLSSEMERLVTAGAVVVDGVLAGT